MAQKLLPAHLYLNPERQEQSLKAIEIKILQLKNKTKAMTFPDRHSATNWIRKNADALGSYLSIISNNGEIMIKRKSNVIVKLAVCRALPQTARSA